jgi:hypothetical protein
MNNDSKMNSREAILKQHSCIQFQDIERCSGIPHHHAANHEAVNSCNSRSL